MKGRRRALLAQSPDIVCQTGRAVAPNTFYLVPICRGHRVAGDHQYVVDLLDGQAQQQRPGGVQIAVPAGHVGKGIDAQFPLELGSHHGAVRPDPGHRAV